MLADHIQSIVRSETKERAHACLSTLLQLVSNVQIDLDKFGRVRGDNKTFVSRVWNMDGGLEAMSALGFKAELDVTDSVVMFTFDPTTHMALLAENITLLTVVLSALQTGHSDADPSHTGIPTPRERAAAKQFARSGQKSKKDIAAELRELAQAQRARAQAARRTEATARVSPALNPDASETATDVETKPSNTRDLIAGIVILAVLVTDFSSPELKVLLLIGAGVYYLVHYQSSKPRINADGSITRPNAGGSPAYRANSSGCRAATVQDVVEREKVRKFVEHQAMRRTFGGLGGLF
ncbi:hypothetical protein HDU90_005013 [Geranomyces variabilis]|nr:hypothetical protein HDU90_005013 [Geranomyces variabilis]